MAIHVTIKEEGSRAKNSKEFGYSVSSDFAEHTRGNLPIQVNYQNRANRMRGQYLLTERRVQLDPSFNPITIIKTQGRADGILYEKARSFAQTALERLTEYLTLELVDETPMSTEKLIKREKLNKKSKK